MVLSWSNGVYYEYGEPVELLDNNGSTRKKTKKVKKVKKEKKSELAKDKDESKETRELVSKLVLCQQDAAATGISCDDKVDKDDDDEVDNNVEEYHCGTCKKLLKDGELQVLCNTCDDWFHSECQEIDRKDYKKIVECDVEGMEYKCKECRKLGCTEKDLHRRLIDINLIVNDSMKSMKSLEARVEEMVVNIDKKDKALQEKVDEMANNMDKYHTIDREKENRNLVKKIENIRKIDNNQTYAEKLKMKMRNTLIVKSTESGSNAGESKKELLSTLKEVQIERVKTTKEGHIVINFSDKNMLERAKQEINNKMEDSKLEIKEKGKIMPKIMLCNVSDEEEEVEIIDNIFNKNQWLQTLIDADFGNFKVVAKQKAKGNTQHFIIKCAPEIRKAILDAGDYLYTGYGRSKVRDQYHVYQCYKCQGFGHNSDECKGEQKCARCGEGHRLKDCASTIRNCVNCCKANRLEKDHWTNSSNCPSYMEEIAKVRNNTDHGF